MEREQTPSQVTAVLQLLGAEPDAALRASASDPLPERVYGELRTIAARLLRRERAGHTLQPTALVHEAYLRVALEDGVTFEDRAHFLGVVARAMRWILVDGARRRAASKRGGKPRRVPLSDEAVPGSSADLELIELHDALSRLADLDERAARVAEMRIFGGMTVGEIAYVLGISARSVDGDWATARAWLSREVRGHAP